MGISAFLPLPMAKEKEKVELRAVDEEAESKIRYVRLGKDAAEEVEELPPVKVGTAPPPGRLDPAAREELKIRSSEPDVGELIERDIPAPEELWETQAGSEGTFPWGWVAVVACIFTVAILWSLVNVNRADDRRQALTEETVAILQKEEQEVLDAELLVGALEAAVRDFFDARSVEEMLRHVRHPERVLPLMEAYYAAQAPKAMRVERLLSLDPLTMDKRASFWMVACELAGGRHSNLLLEAVSESEARIDWETFVCYQPMAWDEFAKTRPGGYTGDFRVYVEKDHFFSHEFADPQAFDCYRLTALNGEESLFGYVPRGSEFAARMSQMTTGNRVGAAPMILRLHVPEGVGSPRGLLVQALVNPRWAFIENPAKEER